MASNYKFGFGGNVFSPNGQLYTSTPAAAVNNKNVSRTRVKTTTNNSPLKRKAPLDENNEKATPSNSSQPSPAKIQAVANPSHLPSNSQRGVFKAPLKLKNSPLKLKNSPLRENLMNRKPKSLTQNILKSPAFDHDGTMDAFLTSRLNEMTPEELEAQTKSESDLASTTTSNKSELALTHSSSSGQSGPSHEVTTTKGQGDAPYERRSPRKTQMQNIEPRQSPKKLMSKVSKEIPKDIVLMKEMVLKKNQLKAKSEMEAKLALKKSEKSATYSKGFSPKKLILSPKKKILSPIKKILSPKKKVILPKNEIISPQEEIIALRREIASLKKEIASPKNEIASPIKRIPSPKKIVSPTKQIASSKKKIASAKKTLILPEKDQFFSKKKNEVSPDKRSQVKKNLFKSSGSQENSVKKSRKMAEPSKSLESNTTKPIGAKKRKMGPGMRLSKEIRMLQGSTDMLIPKASFGRLVREICQDITKQTLRWQSAALQALQESTESFLTNFLGDSYLLALHAKRKTLRVADVQLLTHIKKLNE